MTLEYFRKWRAMRDAYGNLQREFNELSHINQENLYCNAQLKTALRLKDIELAAYQKERDSG